MNDGPRPSAQVVNYAAVQLLEGIRAGSAVTFSLLAEGYPFDIPGARERRFGAIGVLPLS